MLFSKVNIQQIHDTQIVTLGDINVDCAKCYDIKRLHLMQLFDLKQFVNECTRVTSQTSSIIDHVYSSHAENITECVVPSHAVSDHFPVCFTRRVNGLEIRHGNLVLTKHR